MKPSESTHNPDFYPMHYLWESMKPYFGQLCVIFVLILVNKIILVCIPLSIKYSIDIIQGINTVFSLGQWKLLPLHIGVEELAGFICVALSVHFLANWFQVMISTQFSQNIAKDLREKLFAHVLQQSFRFFDKGTSGKLLTRIVNDIEALNQLLSQGVLIVIGDLFLIVCILCVAFLLDIRLATICLTLLPILYVLMFVFNKYTSGSFLEIRKNIARMNSFLQSLFNGMRVILLFHQKNRMMRQFRKIAKHYLQCYMHTVKVYSVYFPVIDFLSICPQLVFIGIGGYWVYTGEIALSTVITFIFFTPVFFTPLKQISDQINGFQSAIAASKRIIALLAKQDTLEKDSPQQHKTHKIQGKIEFRDVSFAYEENHWVFKNLSFTIQAGQKVALVGQTGSGKTTLIHLLTRFYEINSGSILIDDIDIKDYALRDLRENISYVFQDFYIFSGSIANNIRLFDESITTEDIKQATRDIHAEPFINKLAEKHESILGERGVGISFGEQQLLSFARALVHRRSILVLDEVTSNIDLKTETLIQDNIHNIIQGRTTLIIAHRLSTIREADLIIVLEHGTIQEMGTHETLWKQRGAYWRLHHS